MTPLAWGLLVLVVSVPLLAMVWLRWRFRPARMHRDADRMIAERAALMGRKTEAELVDIVRNYPYIRGKALNLLNRGHYAALNAAWSEVLLEAEKQAGSEVLMRGLDQTLDVGAAIYALATRKPAS
jgi:hypothetical protein